MSEYLTPLYKGEHLKDDQCPFDANTGLWYDKFCNQWKNINGTWNLEKKKWLESVQKNKVGDPNLLNEMVIRYIQLVQSLGGEIRFFRNTVPFVTGLGRTHPVETGFTWHYNLGHICRVSSVKGCTRLGRKVGNLKIKVRLIWLCKFLARKAIIQAVRLFLMPQLSL